jgi:hypothetical protein
LLTFWYITHKKIKGKEFIHVTNKYYTIIVFGIGCYLDLST